MDRMTQIRDKVRSTKPAHHKQPLPKKKKKKENPYAGAHREGCHLHTELKKKF
jgi:hypothetical protein